MTVSHVMRSEVTACNDPHLLLLAAVVRSLRYVDKYDENSRKEKQDERRNPTTLFSRPQFSKFKLSLVPRLTYVYYLGKQ
jgi:hypothetical protein